MTPGISEHSDAWRIGLMGATSSRENVKKVLEALKVCLEKQQ